jgi:hypothetical protein
MGIALSPAALAKGQDSLYVANSQRGSILLFPNVGSAGVLKNFKGIMVLKGPATRLTIPTGVAPL